MGKDTVSVIVPVYNAVACVGGCVSSLLAQTYTDLEIILVNDGSTDGSGPLLDALAARDSRITVLHRQNGGAADARNAGLARASGGWVAFADADDALDPDCIRVLHACAVRHGADVVCCAHTEEWEGKPVSLSGVKVAADRLITDPAHLYRDMVQGRELYWSCVWGKLYRAELAKACTFPPLRFGEDQLYFYSICAREPRVYLTAHKGYRYVRRPDSLTLGSRVPPLERCRDEERMAFCKLEQLPPCAQAFRGEMTRIYGIYLNALASAAARQPGGDEAVRPYIISRIRGLGGKKGVALRTRITLALYRFLPGLHRRLVRARHGD